MCSNEKPQKALVKTSFDKLDQYFESRKDIPFFLYSKITGEEIDSINQYISIHPLERITNSGCKSYLLKITCTAGGNCAIYKLLKVYNSSLRENKLIGIDRADEENSKSFSYKIIDNKMIELITEEERYNQDGEIVFDTLTKQTLELTGQ